MNATSIRSGPTQSPYAFRALELPPPWERAAKTALLAMATLVDEVPISIKEGRQIVVKRSADLRLATVQMKQVDSSALQPIPFNEYPVNPFPIHSKTDRYYSHLVITNLDEASLLSLAIVQFELAEIGDHIAHLHPLTFMTIVFNDPDLTKRLERIFNSPLKRLGLMNGNGIREGFKHQLNREWERDNLLPYLEAFAASVHVPPEELRPIIQKRAWTDLYNFLIGRTIERGRRSYRA